jgi:hypothetical protein
LTVAPAGAPHDWRTGFAGLIAVNYGFAVAHSGSSNTMNQPRISADGLRYKPADKAPGSPFGKYNTESVRSCFLCSEHKPIQQGVFKRLLGKSQFVCNVCLEARAKKKAESTTA